MLNRWYLAIFIIGALFCEPLAEEGIDDVQESEAFGFLMRARRPHDCGEDELCEVTTSIPIEPCEVEPLLATPDLIGAAAATIVEQPLAQLAPAVEQPITQAAAAVAPAPPLASIASDFCATGQGISAVPTTTPVEVLEDDFETMVSSATDALTAAVTNFVAALSAPGSVNATLSLPRASVQLPLPQSNLSLDIMAAINAARQAREDFMSAASASLEWPANSAQTVAAAKDAYFAVLRQTPPPIPRVGDLAAAFRNAGTAFMNQLPPGRYSAGTYSMLPSLTSAAATLATGIPPPELRNAGIHFDRAIMDFMAALDTAWLVALPDALNAAYASAVQSLPQSCAIVDATRAFGLALRSSLLSPDGSSFFTAMSEAVAAYASLFPEEPQSLLNAIAAAYEAFEQNLPTEGVYASIIGGIQNGSILPALASAARAFDDCAPVHPAAIIFSQWLYNLANIQTLNATGAASAVYQQARLAAARTTAQYNRNIRNAANAGRAAYLRSRRGIEGLKESLGTVFIEHVVIIKFCFLTL